MKTSNIIVNTIELSVADSQGIKLMASQTIPSGTASPREAENDAASIANTMVWTFRDIILVLTPIVGQRGVVALYDRSLHLTAKAFSWLKVLSFANQASVDLDALHALLTQQNVATATAGGEALLRTFRDLLATLIGLSLTERLLLPVWEKYLSAPPAQDPSQ